ncbi:hypothetical protein HQ563_06735 [bacterium]|nr:hypothetical protein [bacterium]
MIHINRKRLTAAPAGFILILTWMLSGAAAGAVDVSNDYFPPPESEGGWRKLDNAGDIRRLAGMDPEKLAELKEWLLRSDNRKFAAVVIRRGYIVLEVERGRSSKTDSGRVASCSKKPSAPPFWPLPRKKARRDAHPRR